MQQNCCRPGSMQAKRLGVWEKLIRRLLGYSHATSELCPTGKYLSVQYPQVTTRRFRTRQKKTISFMRNAISYIITQLAIKLSVVDP